MASRRAFAFGLFAFEVGACGRMDARLGCIAYRWSVQLSWPVAVWSRWWRCFSPAEACFERSLPPWRASWASLWEAFSLVRFS